MEFFTSVEFPITAFFPIMAFVLCGFEHSVANMFYVPAGIFENMLSGAEKEILQSLSFAVNMETFTKGVIELNSVLYFIGISVIFLSFTYFNLASRNWRG